MRYGDGNLAGRPAKKGRVLHRGNTSIFIRLATQTQFTAGVQTSNRNKKHSLAALRYAGQIRRQDPQYQLLQYGSGGRQEEVSHKKSVKGKEPTTDKFSGYISIEQASSSYKVTLPGFRTRLQDLALISFTT